MTVIANKGSYQPGDEARIVPQTSIGGGTALVTLERDGILQAFVRKTASFNRHRKLIVALMKHPPARQMIFRSLL